MRLKKYLKSRGFNKSLRVGHAGQAVVEYFVLLVLLAALTIIGGSILFGKVQISTDRFRNSAFEAMVPDPGP